MPRPVQRRPSSRFWFHRWFMVSVMCGAFGQAFAARAFSLTDAFLGFSIRAWQTEEGLPQNTINTIIQSRDGYLWLGTQNGLVRFDGVRFAEFGLRDGLPSPYVTALLEDREGRLWVGTYGGGVSYGKGGRFVTLTRNDGLAGNSISGLAQDGEGNVWIGTLTGLSQWRGGKLTTFGGKEGLPGERVRFLFTDHRGKLWVSIGQSGLLQFLDGRMVEVPVDFPVPDQKVVYCVLEDRKQRIWASVGNGFLLCRESAGWRRYDTTQGVPFAYITCLAEGSDGTIWAGSLDEGLFYLKDGKFTATTRRDGLSDNAIRSLLEDREGNLWVGTRAGGLNRLAPRKLVMLAEAQGLTNEFVRTIAETPDATLWVGTTGGGLYREQNGRFNPFVPAAPVDEYRFVEAAVATPGGTLWWGGAQSLFSYSAGGRLEAWVPTNTPWLRGATVSSLYSDREQRLWLGTARGELRRLTESGSFAEPGSPFGGPITALAQSPEGALWIGTGGAGVYEVSQGKVTRWTVREGLASDFVRVLLFDRTGALWIGAASGGLSRWSGGKITVFTTKQGMLDDTVSQILEDDTGNLWFGGNRGIWRLRQRELDDLARQKIAFVHPLVFGKSDGLQAEECSSGSSPACLKTRSGLLCFATVKGVAVVDPKREPKNVRVPSVLLEDVVVNGEIWTPRSPAPDFDSLWSARSDIPPPTEMVTIPPGGRNVEFHYSGLSYSAPEKIRFRYRLEGVDPHWVEAGTRRVAYYTHIPPGRYRFQVTACNSEGAWNEIGASLAVTLRPHFYQTVWFVGLMIVAGGGALALTVRTITQRNLRRRMQLLEMQHAVEAERTRIARDIHDDLGASLTQITLLGELGRHAADKPGEASQQFEKITSKARTVVQALDEIVWAVNPKNDNLVRLVEYICRFADECFESTTLRCWQEVPAGLPNLPVRAEVRHNLFLAVKEALHNILKHSQAREAWLRIAVRDSALELTIEDNGMGFNPAKADFSRNGLKNMKTRIADIGGTLDLQSEAQRGTRIQFSIPLQAAPSNSRSPRISVR